MKRLSLFICGLLCAATVTTRAQSGVISGTNISWNFEGGTMTFVGTGKIPDRIPWSDANSITAIVIRDGFTSIGEGSFANLQNLISVTIPETVTSIGARAFAGCPHLLSVTIPETVKTIGREAFDGCLYLTEITIPKSVTTIGFYAFRNCTNLTTVNYNAINCTYDLSGYADYSMPYRSNEKPFSVVKENSMDGMFVGCTNLTGINFGNEVTSIAGYNNFQGSNFISVTIPNSVKIIGENVFSNCKNLKSVTIGNSVGVIGKNAFNGCTKLASVIIGNSVVSIGENAFYKCGLTNVTVLRESPPVANSAAFQDVNKFACTINVPAGSKAKYTETDNWKDFVNIVEKESAGGSTAASGSVQRPPDAAVTVRKSDVDENIPSTIVINEKAFAVIIVNENYRREQKVEFALNDGEAFRQYCILTLGLPITNIHYAADATLNDIRSEVRWLGNVADAFKGEASIIFYYAGHGIPDESSRTSYLLPVDGNGQDVSSAYKLDDLYQALGNMPARSVTVFMDACFSGSQRGGGMMASSRGIVIKSVQGRPTGKTVVFSAAQGDETAYPYREKQHGMFTYFLLKKLKESKGDVTLGELGDYIETNVRQQAIVVNSKNQTPAVTPSADMGEEWKRMKLK